MDLFSNDRVLIIYDTRCYRLEPVVSFDFNPYVKRILFITNWIVLITKSLLNLVISIGLIMDASYIYFITYIPSLSFTRNFTFIPLKKSGRILDFRRLLS